MLSNNLDVLSKSAVDKKEMAHNKKFVFLMRSIIAGFYIIVATILSNDTAAVLMDTAPQWGRLLSSLLFATAIILIVFLGGELFTGNNITMAIGAFDKKVAWKDVIYVWCLTFVGNVIGCVFLSMIFYYSNSWHDLLVRYYDSFIMGKLTLSIPEMVLRGILCNVCVCIAVVANVRMKSESGKLIVMYMSIMAFVAAGFEHCVANMGTFTMGWLLLGGLPVPLLIKNFVFVTLGNIIGGAFVLGWPLFIISKEE